MTVHEIVDWMEKHSKFVGMMAATLPLAFTRIRKFVMWPMNLLVKWLSDDRLEFQKEIRTHIVSTIEERVETRAAIEEIREMAVKADKALFNHGRAGIVQQMQILVAESNVGFETSPWPSFKCDQAGCNILTNAAYRRLVGATRSESLAGHQWQTATYGPLEDKYKADFALASERCEDFIGECDFRNPQTGEHVGQWRVIAPVVSVGEGLIYLGVLKVPLDEVAAAKAAKFGIIAKPT